MKNIITILVIIGMVMAGVAFAATPLDAVQNTGKIEHGMISLENVNSTVFNDEAMNSTLGNTSGQTDAKRLDTDLMWRESIDRLNASV